MANIATSTQGPLGTSSEKRKRDETTAKDDPGVDNIKRSAKAKDASADNTPEDHTFLFEGEIDAEPAKVFAVITDLSLAPKIDPSIVSVTPLKGATKGGNAKGDDEDDAKAADVTSKSRERQGWLAFLPGLFRKRELPNPEDLEFGVGYRWKEVRKMFYIFRASAEVEVTEYSPEELVYSIVIDDDCNHVTATLKVLPGNADAGSKCTLRYSGEAMVHQTKRTEKGKKEKVLVPSPFMAKMIRKMDCGVVARYKTYIESMPVNQSD
mmetsp:Transcript_3123/g.11265  ORF Transcript_3123/g.11265 Transcript_3123/m.11265 type:complete len:266 (+) Transcript_3123:31-828(+)